MFIFGIAKVQQTKEWFDLNGTQQYLHYAEDVNLRVEKKKKII
jgi:hypothetical protein